MITSFITLSLLHWVVLITPGVNFLLVTQLAANGKRASAIYSALGISLATLIWALMAVAGVHAVFAAHEWLRLLMQTAGAIYLLWLAAKMTFGGRSQAGSPRNPIVLTATNFRMFRTGLITNMLNPKPALFFSSMFVTILPVGADFVVTVGAIALVWVNSVLWHVFLATAFSLPTIQRLYASQRQRLNSVAAAVLGVMGLKMLFQSFAPSR